MEGIAIRRARFGDLEGIVGLYAADALGGHGDGWSEASRPAYERAMRTILTNPSQRLFVAMEGERVVDTGRGLTAEGGEVVGVLQLNFAVGLTGCGRTRCRVTGVEVAARLRSRGIGARMMAVAIEEARSAGAGLLDLTSNAVRADAHRFYERLGFRRSHAGFSMSLA